MGKQRPPPPLLILSIAGWLLQKMDFISCVDALSLRRTHALLDCEGNGIRRWMRNQQTLRHPLSCISGRLWMAGDEHMAKAYFQSEESSIDSVKLLADFEVSYRTGDMNKVRLLADLEDSCRRADTDRIVEIKAALSGSKEFEESLPMIEQAILSEDHNQLKRISALAKHALRKLRPHDTYGLLAELEAAQDANDENKIEQIEATLGRKTHFELLSDLEDGIRLGDLVSGAGLYDLLINKVPLKPENIQFYRTALSLFWGVPEVFWAGSGVPEKTAILCPVWYATNRNVLESAGTIDDSTIDLREEWKSNFGNDIAEQVILGKLWVNVPHTQRIGGSDNKWYQSCIQCLPMEKLSLLSQYDFSGDEQFFKDVQKHVDIMKQDLDETHALVFIHDYSNSFESAAKGAAQLSADLEIQGPVAFFSWPSKESQAAYAADEATIKAGSTRIKDFLTQFANRCGAEKTHIIGLGAGNRALLEALYSIARNEQERKQLRLGQIILAAPDIDSRTFKSQAEVISKFIAPPCIERKTWYARNGERGLGDRPLAGFDTVLVPKWHTASFIGQGHSEEAKELLKDMYNLIHHNEDPRYRLNLIPVEADDSEDVWSFKS